MTYRGILGKCCVFMLCLCGGYILQGGRFSYQPRKPSVEVVPAKKPAVSFAKLPLSFEANQGQTDAHVKFVSRGSGYTLFLTGDEVTLELTSSRPESRSSLVETRKSKIEFGKSKVQRAAGLPRPILADSGPSVPPFQPRSANASARPSAVVRMKLLGANPAATVKGEEILPGNANYFIGHDPHKWQTNVPTYAKVKYHGVYPGVDLVFYGNQQQLEHDFVVSPGADASRIAFRLGGSRKMSLDAQGNLDISVAGGEVHLQKPLIYQEGSGGRREIPGGYVLKGTREVAFKVGDYDPKKPLVIDPVLAYSTYLGGNTYDYGDGIAVDSSGNTYVSGTTSSSNFPTGAGAFQTTVAGSQTSSSPS